MQALLSAGADAAKTLPSDGTTVLHVAASAGHIDDVIYPRETRSRVASALDFLKDKQTATVPKKHGNIPL